MTALDRKLVRDLLGMKGQVFAICAVVASGVATFTMALTTMQSLKEAQATYYEQQQFADVFTHVKRAPVTLEEQVRALPGVSVVETRIVAEVTLDIPSLKEPASGRLISLPDWHEPRLNGVHLRTGRLPEVGRKNEVVASEAFMEAHQLVPGNKIKAVLNGRKQELTVVGVVLSPEYIFQIRPGDLLPDDKRFGVFWMRYTELAAAFDMQGAFNDICLSLAPEANEQEVLRRLDRLTAPYGGDGAYGRIDQLSYRFVRDEITQLRVTAIIAPSVFFSVSAYLLNVVLSRIIATQREQIAALKAFGYTHLEVGIHYIKMVLLIVGVGVALGTGVGIWLGQGLTVMYTKFYRFPIFAYHYDLSALMLSLGLSSGAALLGTLTSVRHAVKLPPAEAMRPEPPPTYRATLVERLGMQRLLTAPARMILRNLERKPLQAFLSGFGIALAASVLVLGSFTEDAVNYLLEFQYHISQRQQLTLTFTEPNSIRAIHEVQHLPGVLHCEGFRTVPVRLRHENYSRRLGIMGLPTEPVLNRVLDEDLSVLSMPSQGLILSKKLAELLQVKVGEVVRVEVLEATRPVREVPVVGIVADFAGSNAYMDINALQRLVGEGETYSGAYLSVDTLHLPTLYHNLKETPKVAGVTVQEAAISSFRATMEENMLRMRTFNVIFASIIAAGVVYNTARISLAERSRELATLRVLGFTRGEISSILLGELAVLTLVAIPFGLGMGYLFAAIAVAALETDLFRIPLVINASTYAFAASVVLVATIVSGLIVRRKLDHLDLVAVLKSKE